MHVRPRFYGRYLSEELLNVRRVELGRTKGSFLGPWLVFKKDRATSLTLLT